MGRKRGLPGAVRHAGRSDVLDAAGAGDLGTAGLFLVGAQIGQFGRFVLEHVVEVVIGVADEAAQLPVDRDGGPVDEADALAHTVPGFEEMLRTFLRNMGFENPLAAAPSFLVCRNFGENCWLHLVPRQPVLAGGDVGTGGRAGRGGDGGVGGRAVGLGLHEAVPPIKD